MSRILVVEDDRATRKGIALALTRNEMEVTEADSGESAVEHAIAEQPDLIILDIRLNGKNGFDICRMIRARGYDAPIIFLTGRTDEKDRIRGLNMADDYVTKPFSLRELVARVHIQLRHRRQANSATQCYFGDLKIDFTRLRATRDGKPVELTPREFEILRYFSDHESEVITRGDLLKAVWKLAPDTATRTVDMHILKLRQKLEADPRSPKVLRSVWGEGYKFVR